MGWTASEIRQIRLIEWIVPQSADTYVPVKPFYDEQAGQDALTLPVVHGELHDLAQRSFIDLAAGIGGVEPYDALATPKARRLVEDLQARRARQAAAQGRMPGRDGRLAVLPRCGESDDTAGWDEMLSDLRWGAWLAEPFSADDLEAAAAGLHRYGLVRGIMIDQCDGLVRLHLTDEGVGKDITCARC